MLVRSDRRWSFPVAGEVLWDEISRVDLYRTWWPWLAGFDGEALEVGETWTCLVQPPLPYALRFTVALDEVIPKRRVAATIAGDITGDASLEVTDTTSGCNARLVSSLAPGNRLLRAVAIVARPMVRYGHDWVLDNGAHQFAARFPRS
jgi:hypothetical protein